MVRPIDWEGLMYDLSNVTLDVIDPLNDSKLLVVMRNIVLSRLLWLTLLVSTLRLGFTTPIGASPRASPPWHPIINCSIAWLTCDTTDDAENSKIVAWCGMDRMLSKLEKAAKVRPNDELLLQDSDGFSTMMLTRADVQLVKAASLIRLMSDRMLLTVRDRDWMAVAVGSCMKEAS